MTLLARLVEEENDSGATAPKEQRLYFSAAKIVSLMVTQNYSYELLFSVGTFQYQ